MMDLSIMRERVGAINSNVAVGAAGVILGAGLGAAAVAIAKRKKSNNKSKRKKSNSYRRRKCKRTYRKGQKKPYTAGCRRDTSHRRIRYTKNNQPYIILKSGKARFIKKSSVSRSRKLKGGRY